MSISDVLVVGSGPAAFTTAIEAAQGGLSVGLVERTRPLRRWPGESLQPGMDRLIASVFGADVLTEARHRRAVGTRSVWGSDQLVETDFITNPLGEGWLVDRARLDADARQVVVAAGVGLTRVRTAGVLSRTQSGWELATNSGETLAARFVVDGTGRSAAVLRQLGIARTADDRQVAILATCADDGDAYAGTTVEAMAEGWWYTTPLPSGRRVVAYLTDADIWRRSARDWHALLRNTRHVRRCVGENAFSAKPATYPAGTATAGQFGGDDWLAVGDAAVSFDPLSSQGLASAILMGARAGQALAHPHRSEAIDVWADAYRMLAAEHADLRRHYTRLETRWPESLFWHRRQHPDPAGLSALRGTNALGLTTGAQ